MKKITFPMAFSKQMLTLFLLVSVVAMVFSPTVMADPVNETAIAKGTLSGIDHKNYPNTTLSQAQIMIAILAENPDAFRGGNINFMSRNITLSLPSEEIIASVSEANAASLLIQHNHFYQQGKTGNLSPPTFIKIQTGDPVALEKLRTQHSAQTERVEALSAESTKLQSLVTHLESEKDQRDEDLRLLEEKIQALKDSGGKRLPGDTSASEERLRDKNIALQQQLVESKSELIENNRTTISLERRVLELQEEKQDNTKQGNNNPVIKPPQQNEDTQSPPQQVATTDAFDAPRTDLNGNINSPEKNLLSSFGLGDKLAWLLPLLAILAGLGFLIKRFFGRKKHSELNLDEVDEVDFTTPKMSKEDRKHDGKNTSELIAEAPLEVSIKLDVARAYMESGDNQSAYEMLQEVLREGSKEQQEEATLLLNKLSTTPELKTQGLES
jgi:FimV-like protein